jgi:hypothetical protein
MFNTVVTLDRNRGAREFQGRLLCSRICRAVAARGCDKSGARTVRFNQQSHIEK